MLTKTEVGYSPGKGGECVHYRSGSCEIVEGKIDPGVLVPKFERKKMARDRHVHFHFGRRPTRDAMYTIEGRDKDSGRRFEDKVQAETAGEAISQAKARNPNGENFRVIRAEGVKARVKRDAARDAKDPRTMGIAELKAEIRAGATEPRLTQLLIALKKRGEEYVPTGPGSKPIQAKNVNPVTRKLLGWDAATVDPLVSGSSRAAVSKNIATEVAAGKPRAQAVAIALSKAGLSNKDRMLFAADDARAARWPVLTSLCKDMTPADWEGVLKFVAEEMAEPEHREDVVDLR